MILKELDHPSPVCNKEIDLPVKFKGSSECEVTIKKDSTVNLSNKNSPDYLIE